MAILFAITLSLDIISRLEGRDLGLARLLVIQLRWGVPGAARGGGLLAACAGILDLAVGSFGFALDDTLTQRASRFR